MTPSEKVAYLKGLVEGMGLDLTTKEGKVLDKIMDILEDLAFGLADAEENALNIGDELDQLSDDLADVEEIVYADDDEDDESCCGGCGRGRVWEYDGTDDEDDDDEDEDEYSVTCPNCNMEIIVTGSDVESGSIVCPNCDKTLELEFDDEDEEPDED